MGHDAESVVGVASEDSMKGSDSGTSCWVDLLGSLGYDGDSNGTVKQSWLPPIWIDDRLMVYTWALTCLYNHIQPTNVDICGIFGDGSTIALLTFYSWESIWDSHR